MTIWRVAKGTKNKQTVSCRGDPTDLAITGGAEGTNDLTTFAIIIKTSALARGGYAVVGGIDIQGIAIAWRGLGNAAAIGVAWKISINTVGTSRTDVKFLAHASV